MVSLDTLVEEPRQGDVQQSALTKREIDVLNGLVCLAEENGGLFYLDMDQVLAMQLDFSRSAVRNYKYSAEQKLRADNLLQAVVEAAKLGLIDMEARRHAFIRGQRRLSELVTESHWPNTGRLLLPVAVKVYAYIEAAVLPRCGFFRCYRNDTRDSSPFRKATIGRCMNETLQYFHADNHMQTLSVLRLIARREGHKDLHELAEAMGYRCRNSFDK